MAAVTGVACDIRGTPHDQATTGPKIRILSTNIDPVTNEIPSDGALEIAFDRYLLPDTTTRQGYVIGDNTNAVLPPDGLQTIYDPVARTIAITGSKGVGATWLKQGQDYKLVLLVPPDNTTDQNGFRAIDRAPLDSAQKLTYVFRAGAAKGVTSLDPPVDFCADVMPIFQAKCSGPTCHGAYGTSAQTAASLVLNTAQGVEVTARRHVSQAANTGAKAFTPAPDGPVFGVDMAIISPGNPGSSWLMYKVEMAPLPVIDGGAKTNILCTPPDGGPPIPDRHAAPLDPYSALTPVSPASDAERQRLNDLVIGRWMPYASGGTTYGDQPLTFQEREMIRIWIAHGAETRDCGGCGEYTPPVIAPHDAGADAEAGADAGTDADASTRP